MAILKFIVYLIIALALVIFIAGQAGLLRGKAPADIGPRNGKLKPPSDTPNSVTSQAGLYPDHPLKAYAEIAPFTYSGESAAALAKLKSIVQAMPRTVIAKEEPGYLYAQCETQWLKFIDDLEFVVDDTAKVIHVRSASRVGRKDFGVNRARVEAIRSQFTK